MPFSESVKLEVRRRAQLKCCICRDIGVEIHHIIPQANGGEDTVENAAPLCPSCHEKYGDNPKKRKFIREAREVWYEYCGFQTAQQDLPKLLERVASKDDIQALRDEVQNLSLSLISSKLIHGHSSGFQELPLERYIHHLYEKDYQDKYDGYNLLFDSRLWYESGDDTYELLNARKKFLERFGEETARRICLKVQSELNVDLSEFTEEDLTKVIHRVHLEVIVILWHKKFGNKDICLVCGIDEGNFYWKKV